VTRKFPADVHFFLAQTEEAGPILEELEHRKPAKADEYFRVTTPYADPTRTGTTFSRGCGRPGCRSSSDL
jgi:hypothetical protein